MGLFDRIKNWIRTLQPAKLDAFIEEQKGKESLKDALINFLFSTAILYLLIGVSAAIAIIIFGSVISPFLMLLNVPVAAGIGAVLLVLLIALIISYVITIFLLFIFSGILWVFAKLMGGQATYTRQTHIYSYFDSGISLFTIVLMIVNLIPCLGPLISLAFALYLLYMAHRLIKKVHNLSTLKAALVIILPVILIMVIYLVLFLFLGLGLTLPGKAFPVNSAY